MLYGEQISQDLVAAYLNKPVSKLIPQELGTYAYQNDPGNGRKQAAAYLHEQKKNYGTGLSALVSIENFSGFTLKLKTFHFWYGSSGNTAPDYAIPVGQVSAVFTHHPDALQAGVTAAAVYYVMDDIGAAANYRPFAELFLGFDVPYFRSNRVHVEQVRRGIYFNERTTDDMYKKLTGTARSLDTAEMFQLLSVSASIGSGYSPEVRFTVLPSDPKLYYKNLNLNLNRTSRGIFAPLREEKEEEKEVASDGTTLLIPRPQSHM